MARLSLAVAVHPAHCLRIMARVPGSVKHHYSVGTDQIHAQAPSPLKHETITEPFILKVVFKSVLPAMTPTPTTLLFVRSPTH